MGGAVVQFGGKFNAADQLDTGSARVRLRLIIASKRVVISNTKDGNASLDRFFY